MDNLITDTSSQLLRKRTPSDSDRSFYLGHLAQDRKYFKEVLKHKVSNDGPFSEFEKRIQSTMKCVINATDIAEVSIWFI